LRYLLFFTFLILLWSSRYIIGYVATLGYTGGIEVGLGKYFIIVVGVIIFELTILFYNLICGLRKSVLLERQQLIYFLSGLCLFIFPTLLTNLLLPILGIYSLNNWGIVFSFFFTSLTMISIVKYRLFSIQFVFTKVLATFSLGVIFWGIVLAVRYIKYYFWNLNIFDFQALFFDFITSILVASIVEKLSFFLQNRYGTLLNAEISLIENLTRSVSKKIREKITYETLTQSLSEIIEENLADIYVEFYDQFSFRNTKVPSVDISKIEQVSGICFYQEMNSGKLKTYFSDKKIICVAKLSQYIYLILYNNDKRRAFTSVEIDAIIQAVSILEPIFLRVDNERMIRELNENLQNKVSEQTKEIRLKMEHMQQMRDRERDMLDIMGHELRTPLTIIKNATELLELSKKSSIEREGKPVWDEMVEKQFNHIRGAMRRELGLVETLLSATKLDANRLQVNMTTVDLTKVVENTELAFRKDAENKGLKFGIIHDRRRKCEVKADTLHLQQVVDNLVSNAVKYTMSGSVSIRIMEEEKEVMFEIRDTGEGMSKDDLKNLGKKFYRANQYINDQSSGLKTSVVRPGGTGLGLYVTFGLIKAMGGRYEIESELGNGSVFRVYLLKS